NTNVRKGFEEFGDNFNDFFGIKPKGQETTEHITKETAIDVSPEDLWATVEKNREISEKLSLVEAPAEKKKLLEIWDENWKGFANNTMIVFDNIKNQIEEANRKNAEEFENAIKIGKANYTIFLKKEEIRKAKQKEKQKLALERFKEQQKQWAENNAKFFSEQQELWKGQIDKWKEEQKEIGTQNKEKWDANQKKFWEDYYSWIDKRRERAMEKSKYKLRIGWRKSLFWIMNCWPFIVLFLVIAVILTYINNMFG
ncbi:MAG: hypothetical protein GY870_03915, partial [archaeon]|nr:hypothetical protein [archaeon]